MVRTFKNLEEFEIEIINKVRRLEEQLTLGMKEGTLKEVKNVLNVFFDTDIFSYNEDSLIISGYDVDIYNCDFSISFSYDRDTYIINNREVEIDFGIFLKIKREQNRTKFKRDILIEDEGIYIENELDYLLSELKIKDYDELLVELNEIEIYT